MKAGTDLLENVELEISMYDKVLQMLFRNYHNDDMEKAEETKKIWQTGSFIYMGYFLSLLFDIILANCEAIWTFSGPRVCVFYDQNFLLGFLLFASPDDNGDDDDDDDWIESMHCETQVYAAHKEDWERHCCKRQCGIVYCSYKLFDFAT